MVATLIFSSFSKEYFCVAIFYLSKFTLNNDTYNPWCYRRCQVLNARMAKRADILIIFGQQVRKLRKAQGYSQENFAYACELDRTYVGGIERGERNLSLRNIERIADTLGISLSELMDGV